MKVLINIYKVLQKNKEHKKSKAKIINNKKSKLQINIILFKKT